MPICKILRLFAYALTPDDKYSLPSRDNLMQPIQIHLSQKKNTLIVYVFPKLLTTHDMLRQMPKKSRFRGPHDTQRGKRSEKH